MNRDKIHRRVLLGVFILIIGVLSLLDNLHLFDTRDVLHFWPMVFVAFGALKLLQTRSGSGYLVGGGMMLAGVLITLQDLGLLTIRWREWWPVVLILAGLVVIFKDRLGQEFNSHQDLTALDGHSRMDLVAVMSGNKLKIDAQDFRGGEITAVMGGVDLDLRRASLAGDEATIQLFAMWGGIEIKVPADWTVVVRGVPILGGIEDKTVPPLDAKKRLFISGYVLMGGVEILN